ncbi:hypothetical protein R1sor_008276 [Riccia sorocarpa]|uniref:Uncharacterized protein n=1 Tax=Riccia sorocarpa TaxID=122646 RepID=A0ABD3HWZ8_9MARC
MNGSQITEMHLFATRQNVLEINAAVMKIYPSMDDVIAPNCMGLRDKFEKGIYVLGFRKAESGGRYLKHDMVYVKKTDRSMLVFAVGLVALNQQSSLMALDISSGAEGFNLVVRT